MKLPRTPLYKVALGAFCAVALSCTGALADNEPGVSATEILIGGTHPYSGPASTYSVISKGIAAYLAYVNAKGGVYGRKITYKDQDDAYSPQQTVPLVKALVEQDHVFAMFNTLGTAPNLAIRQYLNDNKVPDVFVSTGATTWGADADKYPWTLGFNLDYQAEAISFGKAIVASKPGAKIAILYQNDNFGQDYITGLTKGLGSHASDIIKTVSYESTDPDVRSQMGTLQSSGADTLLIAAVPKFAVQVMSALATMNWHPTTYLTNVSASNTIMQAATKSGGESATDGIISDAYTMDPTNPSLASTPGMKLYKDVLAKYGNGADPNDGFVLYGMAAAYALVDALQHAGKDLTREKLMSAATHLNEKNPFLWPGVELQTSPGDRFPIREMQLLKYGKGSWTPVGAIIDARK